jgi:hypothetical protein
MRFTKYHIYNIHIIFRKVSAFNLLFKESKALYRKKEWFSHVLKKKYIYIYIAANRSHFSFVHVKKI